MSKLKILSGKEVVKIFSRFDFKVISQRGSHFQASIKIYPRRRAKTLFLRLEINSQRDKRYKGLYPFSDLGIKMGGIKLYISDEVERKFRETAMRLYGYGKGSLSIASEKAILAWLSQVSEVLDMAETIEDPVETIYGMLSHVKRTGVELQHEAREIRAKRALGYRNAT